MHEMSLMSEILNIVSEDAKQRRFTKVERIDVIVGDLSNVLPDALEMAFFYMQKQGMCLIDDQTELRIIREVAKANCQTCQLEFVPDYRIALCPICQLPNGVLVSGETFKVESYEGKDEHF
ncbi:hydrogenase maturation nickel metallochaperone HypA [Anaerobacillus sp. CMMVII]|nr:hydrogenase maturation nickel metallochaperone HypA [Anaerobacillus sp. CMMVII]